MVDYHTYYNCKREYNFVDYYKIPYKPSIDLIKYCNVENQPRFDNKIVIKKEKIKDIFSLIFDKVNVRYDDCCVELIYDLYLNQEQPIIPPTHPKYGRYNKDRFYSYITNQQLRSMFYEYRNIKKNWNFSNTITHKLKDIYNLNKDLLLEYSNSNINMNKIRYDDNVLDICEDDYQQSDIFNDIYSGFRNLFENQYIYYNNMLSSYQIASSNKKAVDLKDQRKDIIKLLKDTICKTSPDIKRKYIKTKGLCNKLDKLDTTTISIKNCLLFLIHPHYNNHTNLNKTIIYNLLLKPLYDLIKEFCINYNHILNRELLVLAIKPQ